MKITDFAEANAVLTAPKGQEDKVNDLPVCRIRYADGSPSTVISCWELSDEEREAIAAGGLVYLQIQGVTHPPVLPLGTEPPEFAEIRAAMEEPCKL